MNKKIVFFLYDLSMGGTETIVVRLSNYLIKKGYQIDILLINNNNVFANQIDPKIKVISLNRAKISESLTPLIKFLKKSEYDFFLSNVWPLTIVSVLAFLFSRNQLNKLILIEHCHLKEEFHRRSWLFKTFQRISIATLYNLANMIISVSDGVQADLIEKGVNKRRSKVIYNPAFTEPELKEKGLPEKALSWAGKKGIKIIAVGNFKTQKNYPNLIKSLDILIKEKGIDCSLLIVGDGPNRLKIEKEISDRQLDKNVYLLGRYLEPLDLINLADLFVLSSDFEGFGLVIVEALSLGKTVVSTDCKSGPAEILGNNEYGYLCEVDNPQDLAEKIKYAVNNKIDANILVRRARDFSVEKIGTQYENIFNQK